MMDKELRGLFNYQHFQGNEKLNSVISKTLDKYNMEEIELDDLDMVNAAGIDHNGIFGQNVGMNTTIAGVPGGGGRPLR